MRSWGQGPQEGISALIRWASSLLSLSFSSHLTFSLPSLFSAMWRHTEKAAIHKPRREPPLETGNAGNLILHFQPNKFLLSHPGYGILYGSLNRLWQLGPCFLEDPKFHTSKQLLKTWSMDSGAKWGLGLPFQYEVDFSNRDKYSIITSLKFPLLVQAFLWPIIQMKTTQPPNFVCSKNNLNGSWSCLLLIANSC